MITIVSFMSVLAAAVVGLVALINVRDNSRMHRPEAADVGRRPMAKLN
ncbi:hypothetical protein [Streptomyces sp. SID3343]|nr:hypothetical protein [Streptomyces sp. SID3343]MYW06464.1 hypothetical protein [Streptomyces sp. SID3343]